MTESYLYELFRQDALETVRKEMTETLRKEALELLRKEGLEKWRHEGLEKGAVMKVRNNILNALRVRFQDVPSSIQMFVESVEQESTLDIIFEQAITAASITEFEGFLHNMRS